MKHGHIHNKHVIFDYSFTSHPESDITETIHSLGKLPDTPEIPGL